MATIEIRRAEIADADAVIALVTALAHFESLPPPDAGACQRFRDYGWGDRPRFEAWLAFLPNVPQPVACAIFFETFSTFLARPTLYLEDLFVLPEHRRQGVGRALLNHCMRLAQERGCGRMEWSCLDWNTKAQAVYEGLGARRLNEWFVYRLTREQLAEIEHS